jgi:Uma2 family endonuclease
MDTLLPSRAIVRRTTQAAEGQPRWRWTTAEIEQLSAEGAFVDADEFELFDGEIVPMAADGLRHALIEDAIAATWVKRDLTGLRFGEQKQFNLDEATFVKPDLLVWPEDIKIPFLKGPEALLVVEVAGTSLGKDLGLKRRTYAKFGVREYWVVDAKARSTIVHRNPADGDYASVVTLDASTLLTPLLVPVLAVRLADMDIS